MEGRGGEGEQLRGGPRGAGKGVNGEEAAARGPSCLISFPLSLLQAPVTGPGEGSLSVCLSASRAKEEVLTASPQHL